MRSLLCVALVAASALCAQAQVTVDVQGSVDSWPSALSNSQLEILVNVSNQTVWDTQDRTYTFDPDNWPSPNELTFNVLGVTGDVIKVLASEADNDVTELTGSDGKSYSYWLDGNATKTHTIAATDPIPLELSISVSVKCELTGDTDSDGDVDATDIATIVANFGSSNASWSDGDIDGDGDVDFSDYLLANANL